MPALSLCVQGDTDQQTFSKLCVLRAASQCPLYLLPYGYSGVRNIGAHAHLRDIVSLVRDDDPAVVQLVVLCDLRTRPGTADLTPDNFHFQSRTTRWPSSGFML